MSAQPAAAAEPAAGPSGIRGGARRVADAVLNPSRLVMRRIALAGVIASALIIPSGGAVRLSDSGLGCTNWPKCTATSLGATGATGAPLIHQWIEFGNRLVTVAIFVIALVCFIAAWRFRDGPAGRRRRDLVWLASAQPAGIAGQAIIGGIVVLTHLNPYWVSVHFLLTVPVLAAAVALHVRCAETTGPARPLVQRPVQLVAWALVAVVAMMFAAGTLVTGTGPLAGAPKTPRYTFASLAQVTQLHADIGWALGVLAILLLVMLYMVQAPARAIRLSKIVIGLIAAQGVIGYVQYFSHLPAGLIWLHVANTALIWIAACRLVFALRDRGQLGDSPAAGTAGTPALSAGPGAL